MAIKDDGVAPDSIIGISWKLLDLIKNNLRFLFLVGFISAVASVTWALLLPNVYKSHCTVLPAEASSGTFSLLSQITGMSGFSTGGSTETYLQLYPIIAKSRAVLEPLLDVEYNEEPLWKTLLEVSDDDITDSWEMREKALLVLQGGLGTSADLRQGLFNISFENKDKFFAAFLVNHVVESMDDYFKNNLRFEAKKKRTMIEARLDSVSISLFKAENELLEFRLRNRNSKLSSVLSMEEGRLQRQVDIKSAVFVELNRQQEVALIEEGGGDSVMKVLDKAVPPFRKSGPARALIVIFSVLGCQVLALTFCGLRR